MDNDAVEDKSWGRKLASTWCSVDFTDPYSAIMPLAWKGFAMFEKVGSYLIVGHDSGKSEPTLLILDTNVAIDIERFYFGGHVNRPELRTLLERFPEVQVSYGLALQEISYARTGDLWPEKFLRANRALSMVLGWGPREIRDAFENPNPPVRRDMAWPVSLPKDDELPGHPGIMLVGPYGSLLKLCQLESIRDRRGERGPIWAAKEYVRWLRDVLGVRGSYEVAFGLDLFVGSEERRNDARRMLKLGGREAPNDLASRCWNAAWDIHFVRMVDLLTYGGLGASSTMQTCVITRNSDPAFLRSVTEVHELIFFPKGPVPLTAGDWYIDPNSDHDWQDLLDLNLETSLERSTRDPQDIFDRECQAVAKLEEEMGVSPLTRLVDFPE